ncbi:MAG TPA: transcription elongation factor GreA [Myxococcota bacterium]|nr:transcription elongation factor GreA [Myxococcota bacterium]
MNKLPITPQGFEKLSKELEHLTSVVRPQVISDLAEARSHGDLSENAEYDAAKERQGMVEARIRFLKSRLQQYEIVDPESLQGDKVTFGATVSIIDCETEKEETWQIVGEDEADLKEKRISISSPIGRALIGKEVGDAVEIRTPKGQRACEITRLRFS